MVSTGGINFYKKSEVEKVLSQIVHLFLELFYPKGSRNIYSWNKTLLMTDVKKVTWKNDLSVEDESQITLEMIAERTSPFISIWTKSRVPFISEEVVRISIGSDVVDDFILALRDILFDNNINAVFHEKT
jgi:hypothetical protein